MKDKQKYKKIKTEIHRRTLAEGVEFTDPILHTNLRPENAWYIEPNVGANGKIHAVYSKNTIDGLFNSLEHEHLGQHARSPFTRKLFHPEHVKKYTNHSSFHRINAIDKFLDAGLGFTLVELQKMSQVVKDMHEIPMIHWPRQLSTSFKKIIDKIISTKNDVLIKVRLSDVPLHAPTESFFIHSRGAHKYVFLGDKAGFMVDNDNFTHTLITIFLHQQYPGKTLYFYDLYYGI